jgi:hypothetical protein
MHLSVLNRTSCAIDRKKCCATRQAIKVAEIITRNLKPRFSANFLFFILLQLFNKIFVWV